MAKFTEHTIVHRDGDPVPFKPGDDVPDWAVDLVGAHVIDASDGEQADDPAEGDGEQAATEAIEATEATADTADAAEDEPAGKPAEGEQPDFTAPAKPKRGRPRKAD